MVQIDVLTVQSPPVTERQALRAGLEETRVACNRFLDSVSSDRWVQKSPGSAWTISQVFVHLTWALEYLPKEVASAQRGKGMFNFPKWLADPGSYWYVRLIARNSTREAIRRRYNAAMDAAIEALEKVPDSDWDLGAAFYGEGFHSVADLFRAPAKHLAEHTVGL